MNDSNQVVAKASAATPLAARPPMEAIPPMLLLSLLGLVLCFSLPLYKWAQFALQSGLYSYALLVPFVSLYLLGLGRKQPLPSSVAPSKAVAVVLIGSGLTALGYYLLVILSGGKFAPQNSTALTTLSFVLLASGLCAWWMPPGRFRQSIFPLGFLFFMVPFPLPMEHGIESFLQHGSVPPAYWLFRLAGTTLFREGLVFQLPGITLQVAPECSGIRSTIVLFMVSLLAGHLFLRSPWKRVILSVAVIPLALVRNGFRIFTIGQLCVSVGPHMIDSPIHHRGGPIFFALSLIPFFALVYLLVKSDRSARTVSVVDKSTHG
jgi:exosortase C (VPDSG-CTERM-specific)